MYLCIVLSFEWVYYRIQSLESRQKPAWIFDFTCDTSNRPFSECNIVSPIGYGQCKRSGDILVVDCGKF